MERLVEVMQRLKFNATESRLYTALVLDNPSTGYELAARSGVPRSAIYSTLKKMQERGWIRAVSQNPAKYVPLPPEELCDRLRRHYDSTLDDLQTAFQSLPKRRQVAELWQVFGHDEVLAEAAQMLEKVETHVVASLWRREAEALRGPLEALVAQGKKVTLFSFTELPDLGACNFAAGIDESALEAYWPHRMVLVLDRKRTFVAELQDDQEPYAVITEEPALVSMASNNLILDLTLHGQRFGVDVSGALEGLHARLAPIEDLLSSRGKQ